MNEPWPKSKKNLIEYIDQQIHPRHGHDYNSAPDAAANAALAAFNYVATELGMTGFQAGYAQMQFIKTSRHIEGPFMILDATQMLYPQYDPHNQVQEFLEECKPALGEIAKKKLEEGPAHPSVEKRWREYAKYAEEKES